MKVTRESAVQVYINETLTNVEPGTPYELPDDEAKALIEAGVVKAADRPSTPPPAPVAPTPAPPIGVSL